VEEELAASHFSQQFILGFWSSGEARPESERKEVESKLKTQSQKLKAKG
jgi:hypothetical protein